MATGNLKNKEKSPHDVPREENYESSFGKGERLNIRHILFAITPDVDATKLREFAEKILEELIFANDGGEKFENAAEKYSDCPVADIKGNIGWLTKYDCTPEFAKEVFDIKEKNALPKILPKLIQSRFGFHIVEILEREEFLNKSQE